MGTGACSGSKLDTGVYDQLLPSTPDLKIDRMNKNQQKSSLNVTLLLKMKSLLCMTAYRTLHRKMIKNGYKRRYFGGRESSDWVCAPLVVNFTLAPAGEKQSRGLFSSEHCRFAVAVLLSSQSSLQSGLARRRLGFCAHHVIRQQLMQRGPSLLFRAPFFFFGARIAMMASSKTVFRPFWVRAEHST